MISIVVRKKEEARRLPEQNLGTDLGRLTLLKWPVTTAHEGPRDPPGEGQGRCPRPTTAGIAFSRHYRTKSLLGVFKVPERVLFNGNAITAAVRG
jgi:hypothetical protein